MDYIDDILAYQGLRFHVNKIAKNSKLVEAIERTTTGLEHLRTFLMYAKCWDDADLLHDYSLVPDIEAAITEIFNLKERLYFELDLVDDYRRKIEAFRPRIKKAYDFFLKRYSFLPNSAMSSGRFWIRFCDSIRDNLQHFWYCKDDSLVKEELEALQSTVRSVKYLGSNAAWSCPHDHQATKDLWTHLGSVIVRAAHLSYLCSVDEMDEKASHEMIIMIHDVQKKLKPNTPEFMKLYLTVLHQAFKSAKSDFITRRHAKEMADCFLDILVPAPDQRFLRRKKASIKKDRRMMLRQGFESLLMFLTDAPHLSEDDVESLLIAPTKVAIEVQSLSHSLSETVTWETDLALFKLLEKMELVKVEIMLLKLLNQEARSQLQQDGENVVKDRIDSLHHGLTFLGAFLEELGEQESAKESLKLIWMQMEALAKEASSLCLSFHTKEVTKERAKDGLCNLLDNINLFKLGTFLMELLNSNLGLMVPLNDQIETLHNGLVFIRTFLMGPFDDNGKHILPHAQSVAKEAAAFYCSFHDSKITEELVSKMNLLLPDLLKNIIHVRVEISDIYQQVQSSFRSNVPKTNGLGFLDFLLGNLKDLMNSNAFCLESNRNYDAGSLFFVKHHIEFVYNEMKILTSFFKGIVGQFNGHLELQELGLQIMNMAYESEYLIDSFFVKDGVLWYHVIWLADLVEQIKLIRIQVSRMFEEEECDLSMNDVSQTLRYTTSSARTPRIDELVVDLPDQAELVLNQLNRGSLQRDVVSIIGMPGIGKTTLARKAYNEASVIYHFCIRIWCLLPHIYEKRKLLIDILSDVNIEHVDKFLEMSEEDLELELYQCLKGKRYLIVIDDMWSVKALDDLERSLPNDGNGSRILITSCLHDVALNGCSSVHPLRLLTDDESWTLLQKKVFLMDDCPEELLKVGKQIAGGCKGLPLAVVAIAGLLNRTIKAEEWWKQVADNLNSLIADDPQTRCMDILELSYIHLPDYLKSCFLYLGAFAEDKVIHVRKLKWLWIAEGFIHSTSLESLEDVAEDYLMDLIDRNLVLVVNRRSRGNGVKACNVHNMFRDFCLERCREENFLQSNNGYDELFSSSDELDYGVDVGCYRLNSITYEKHRLSLCSKRKHFVTLRPSGPFVRSLLFSATSDMYPRCPYNISFVSSNFKLLRVLDFECINMGHSFIKEIELLAHLRYLSLSGDIDSVPSSIANLRNLETFILKGLKGKVTLPDAIWRMARLRHVHVNCHTACSLPDDMLEGSYQLGNLVTFSSPSLSKGKDSEKLMRMLPKLRRLRCIFSPSQDDSGKWNGFPVLDFLTELESLNIFYSGRIPCPTELKLPLNLKKLTLSNFGLPWNLISEIGRLPSLEVLKLLSRAFEGKRWDMREGEFLKLKFLKLDTLNIAHWNASCDKLPMLEHLALQRCKHLEKVPPDFVNIPTLRMIEMKSCRNSAEESLRILKKDQREMGIEGLQLVINQKVGI